MPSFSSLFEVFQPNLDISDYCMKTSCCLTELPTDFTLSGFDEIMSLDVSGGVAFLIRNHNSAIDGRLDTKLGMSAQTSR